MGSHCPSIVILHASSWHNPSCCAYPSCTQATPQRVVVVLVGRRTMSLKKGRIDTSKNKTQEEDTSVVGCWRRGRKTPSGEKRARSLRPRSSNTTPYVRVPSTSTLHCPICMPDHNALCVLTSSEEEMMWSPLSQLKFCQHRTTCTQTYLTPVPTLTWYHARAHTHIRIRAYIRLLHRRFARFAA